MKPEAGGNDPGKAESLSNRMRVLSRRLQAKLWPRACFACGERAGADILCAACSADLPWLGEACPICGLPSPRGEVCGRCLRLAPRFDATWALLAYEGQVRDMVLALKHGRGFGLVPWLGSALADSFATRFSGPPVDLVLPMPLHGARLRARGFNQAVELARPVCSVMGLKMARELVVRDIDTPCLEELGRKGRRRAVRGAFRCVADLEGSHVLVLDDVMTSGATLDELAAALKARGASRVSNLVLARTLMQEK